jgi:hypothetical protein
MQVILSAGVDEQLAADIRWELKRFRISSARTVLPEAIGPEIAMRP